MPVRSKGRVRLKETPWFSHPVKNNFVQKPKNQPRIGGTYGKRTKQRIRNNDIMMATWNVHTMMQPRKIP
jgi:hypothetical protein